MSEPATFRQHVPALDGIRGIAFLLVFAYHYGNGGVHNTSIYVRSLATICGFGWSGVDLFFVLSGFLITGILYDTREDPGYYKKFYARRGLRILPVYYLFATLIFVIGSHWKSGHISFLFYVGYPAALIAPSLVAIPVHITHLWSLSAEEQFYMGWPWIVAKLRNPMTACVIAGCVALLFRISIWGLGWNPVWAYAFLLARMDALAVGAAIALLWRNGGQTHLQKWAPITLVVTAIILAAMFIGRHTTNHYDVLITTLGFSVVAIAYGALLVISLVHGKVFSMSIFRTFGKYSYGLYLFHFPLTTLLEPLKPMLSLAYVPVCLLMNLALAAASFHFFEQPIMQLKRRFEYSGGSPSSPRIHTFLKIGLPELIKK
jgi:peptidoglycan/LPS O-acetylase OafA/YrhL